MKKILLATFALTVSGYIIYIKNIQLTESLSVNNDVIILQNNIVNAVILIIFMLMMIIFYQCLTITKSEMLNKKHEKYKVFVEEAVNVIANTIDAKDKYTNGHSRRVAKYSAEIARRLNLSEDKVKRIYYIALLHDIGKIGIPDKILNKPDKLTNEEFEVIKKHTNIGGDILKGVSIIKNVEEGAKYHHERYDGSGYSEGLKGDKIPFVARIICVADTYDAMSSDRVYRKALPTDKIIKEFEEYSNKQFDPKIANIMIDIIKEKVVNN